MSVNQPTILGAAIAAAEDAGYACLLTEDTDSEAELAAGHPELDRLAAPILDSRRQVADAMVGWLSRWEARVLGGGW